MAEDPEASDLFIIRMKGEAYGLRAVMMYYLLRNHGGYTEDGQLMGVPIFLEFQDSEYNFNQPRATFEACMQQIYADLDEAENTYLWNIIISVLLMKFPRNTVLL